MCEQRGSLLESSPNSLCWWCFAYSGSRERARACSAAGGGFKGVGLTDGREALVKNVVRGARQVGSWHSDLQ